VDLARLTSQGTNHEHPWKTRRAGATARETARVQTVLLVEDEPEIVGLLTDFLADEGFGVVSAGDPPARSTALAATTSPASCST
jgi:hypothetical protein